MRHTVRQSRENRTITVDFQNEATYYQLLGDGKAFIECVLAFLFALGFQLKHKAPCGGGGCLTRHSHYVRVRLSGVTIWRLQCTTCRAVFTVLPHFVLRYRQMPPEVARDAYQLLGDGKAFIECVLAFLFALGFQLKHKATCGGGGCLTRHSPYVRVRLSGVTIWRLQCTTCRAVCTVLPHFVLRYRQMPPEVARDAYQLLGDGKAFIECVLAFLFALGFQLKHKATCGGGGCLTRHSPYVRVRLSGVTIWRLQ